MTLRIVSIKPESSLYECVKLMAKERINSLLITKERRLVGILTSRDIFLAISKKPNIGLKKTKAIEIASKKLAVIKPSADISQALNKMRVLHFRRLPVVSKGKLLGMITLKDILLIEPQMYEEMKDIMDVKESNRKEQQVLSDWPLEGICENCGALSELLKVEGQILCADCRDEIF